MVVGTGLGRVGILSLMGKKAEDKITTTYWIRMPPPMEHVEKKVYARDENHAREIGARIFSCEEREVVARGKQRRGGWRGEAIDGPA